MKQRKIRLLIFLIVILIGIIFHLLGSVLWNNELVKSIGIELSAAGFIAILLDQILKDDLLDGIKKELRSPLKELGIGKRSTETYSQEFRAAREQVDIIAIAFKMGSEKYQYDFEGKISSGYCNIRILILDPSSQSARLRACDEPDKTYERLKKDVENSIASFKQLAARFAKEYNQNNVPDGGGPPGTLEVRTHESIPYFGYSRMDGVCLFTPYFFNRYGWDSPVIKVEKDSILFHRLDRHFEDLWTEAGPKFIVNIREGSKYRLALYEFDGLVD